MIRTVGSRGIYLPDPHASPRAVVVFEGIWDCIAAHWDAFERDSHEFAFAGVTANTGSTLIRETLKTFYPGVPVVVIGDRDRAGIQAMAKLRRCFPAAVLQGVVATAGKAPKDYREADPDSRWNALLTGVEAALDEWDRRKLGGDSNGRPVILVRPPEHEVVAQAWGALGGQGEVFVRGDRLVHVVRLAGEVTGNIRIPTGSPIVYEATQYWLRDRLSRVARFQRESAEGMTKESMVPDWLPQVLLASTQSSGLLRFKGLVEAPVMRPDGSMLMDEGLDPLSGVYLAPAGPLPMVGELRAIHGTRPFTSEQVLGSCAVEDPSGATLRAAIEALNMNPKGLCGRSLGWILHRHEKVVVDGSYLTRHTGKHKGSWLWVIESVPSEIQLAS